MGSGHYPDVSRIPPRPLDDITPGLKHQPDGTVNRSSSRKYVTSVEEFIEKWGTQGHDLIISAFVERAPHFEGDRNLSAMLGELSADLQSALEDVAR